MDSAKYFEIKSKRIFTIFTDSGSKRVVIFCHGFRGDTNGPNRFFVLLARKLEKIGISSLRFDQYGSGNSDGDFENATFNNWLETTITLANQYLKRGYKISLFGQSMGGACVIVAGSKLGNKILSVVAWAPGIIHEKPNVKGTYMYEQGQRVKWKFWLQAYKANVVKAFSKIDVSTLVFFPTNDEYVPLKDQQEIINIAKPHQKINILKNAVHSKWSYKLSQKVIDQTAKFIASNFK